MSQGFFITGTDTGVGKTTVVAALISILREKTFSLIAYKPVQTGVTALSQGTAAQDIFFIQHYEGLVCQLKEMNTYTFPDPVSPHLAAELSGTKIDIAEILKDYQRLREKYQWIIVEGAGGLGVPLTRDGFLMADLAKNMALPVIIVARHSVGTINHTLLSVKYAQSFGLEIKGIIINCLTKRDGPAEQDNPQIIEKLTGVPLLGVLPRINGLKTGKVNPLKFNQIIKNAFKRSDLFGE